jgi:peptidoglycan/xylan/chitin deacetylase (PgdA/CDA1 family)
LHLTLHTELAAALSARSAIVGRGRLERLWIQALTKMRLTRSVVLGYHGISETRRQDDLSMLQVSPDRFRSQLELLLAAGFDFVTVAELARQAGGGVPPPGLAAVTFDDGMRNNREVALPIMREYGIVATVYVTIGFIGSTSPWIGPAGDGRMCSESDLRDLALAGWEMGAHTLTHPDLSLLDYRACVREIDESRIELQRITQATVETFAYPFGRYGPAAIAAVRDCGLRAAVTTGSGSWAPFELTRAMIGAADPWPVILLKLSDRYEPLLSSHPMRALRHTSKQVRDRVREHQQRGS